MDRVKHLVSNIEKSFDQEIETHQKEIDNLVKLKTQFKNLSNTFISSHEPKVTLKYRIDSLFLREAFQYLVSTPEEVLCMVSGIVINDNSYVLDRLVKINYQSSAVAAKADVKDMFTKLIELDEKHGHLLMAVFHSHPFSGIAGTTPSGVDRNFQVNLETGGYKVIQAIFARDGHIRFFSNFIKFQIDIYGKGVESIHANDTEAVFKINEIKTQSLSN